MALFSSWRKPPVPRSNHNLTHKLRTTHAIGPGYPVLMIPVIPGDEFSIQVDSTVESLPLTTPIYGSVKHQLDFFYAPISLYCRSLHQDVSIMQENGIDYLFPYFRMASCSSVTTLGMPQTTFTGSYVVNPSSALAYLGFPPYFVDGDPEPIEHPNNASLFLGLGRKKYNAIPFLFYWDIFRNWYMNRQEETFPIFTSTSESDPESLAQRPILTSVLDEYYANLTDGQDMSSFMSLLTGYVNTDGRVGRFGSRLAGLFDTTYSPDINNTILSQQLGSTASLQSIVKVENNQIYMDQIVQQKKVWDFFNIVQLSSGKYSEFSRAQYNVKPSEHLTEPMFLGSSSVEILFSDIEQTSASQTGSPQGTPVSRARGTQLSTGRWRKFTFTENGFFCIIASLRPRVNYVTGAKRWIGWTGLMDLFYPAFNGLGFEDSLLSDIHASVYGMPGLEPWPTQEGPFGVAIGQRPAWSEYMTSVDEVRGLFADNSLPWTFNRRYDAALENGDDVEHTNAIDSFVYSTYIDPADYNSHFANIQRGSENFQLNYRFNFKARREVLKRLQPFLGL